MAQSCVNNQYTFLEFLLECPYNEIQIKNYTVMHSEELQDHHVKYNLLNYLYGMARRAIALSALDRIIDTEYDFQRFVYNHQWVDQLVIVDDRPCFENPILSNYSNNTLKAYLYRIKRGYHVLSPESKENAESMRWSGGE